MKREILGVKVDDITAAEALAVVKDRLDQKRKGYIVTPNPEIIMLAQEDEDYRKVLNEAFLSLPDGIGIVLAGKVLNQPVLERITGVDFCLDLAGLCEEHGFNLFLLGAADNVAQRAAQTLRERFLRINIVGTYSPDLLTENRENVIKRLNEQAIDIIIVAFGPPKQEKWISENLEKINAKVAIGVGGALDFIAGEKTRAPSWLRSIGLEWLHRLITDPKRVRRQRQFEFALRVFKEKLSPKTSN